MKFRIERTSTMLNGHKPCEQAVKTECKGCRIDDCWTIRIASLSELAALIKKWNTSVIIGESYSDNCKHLRVEIYDTWRE